MENIYEPSLIDFYRNWIGNGVYLASSDVCIHSLLAVPMYYLFGLWCVILKCLLLNSPVLPQTTLVIDEVLPFPGLTSDERLAFAHKWYSLHPREYPFEGNTVWSRFVHQPSRGLWTDSFAFGRYIVTPFMSVPCTYTKNIWRLVFPWWAPHILCGALQISDDGQELKLTGEFRICSVFAPGCRWFLERGARLLRSQLLETSDPDDGLFFRSDLHAPGWSHARCGIDRPHTRLHNLLYYNLFSTLNVWWTWFLHRQFRDIRCTLDTETGFPRFDVTLFPWWFRAVHTYFQRRKKFILGGSSMLVAFLRSVVTQSIGRNPEGDTETQNEIALSDEELCESFLTGNFAGMLRPLDHGRIHPDLILYAETIATVGKRKFHVFDYQMFYSDDVPVGDTGRRDPCLMRALFADDGTHLQLVCIVDDSTNVVYDPSSDMRQWIWAKNRLYAKVLWISQVYIHLANHLRLAPIAVAVWQLPSYDHWLFQLLHPFLSDLPLVNEVWGTNLILDDFTTGFAPDDRHRSTSLLRAASRSTEETQSVLQNYTPCSDRQATFRVYSQIVYECLRTFAVDVVRRWHTTPGDPTVITFLSTVNGLRPSKADDTLEDDVDVLVDALSWVMYEASFGHSIYHIAPKNTMMEQWGHRVAYGSQSERAFMQIVAMALTLPELMCSLYPLHLDTLGTFHLGESVDVLRTELTLKLEPYLQETMEAPKTIICTHGH